MDTKVKIIYENGEIKSLEFKDLIFDRYEGESLVDFINAVQKELWVEQQIDFRDYFKEGNIEKEEKAKKKITKPERKKIDKNVETTSVSDKIKGIWKNHKKKIIAGILTLTLAFGIGCAAKNNPKEVKAEEQSIDDEYTDNEELNKILKQIAECKDGDKIVDRILLYNDFQKEYNERMQEFKDANGNTVYLKAEEIAAIDAMANATNINVPLTINKDLVICNFLEAGKTSTKAMFISKNKSGFSEFIQDEKVKGEYVEIENSVQNVLSKENNANENCKNAFANLYTTPETYPEATSLSAYDGNLTIAGLTGTIDGSTVTKYQDRTKKDNAILNYNLNYLSAKESSNKELYELTLQAYEIMNNENIKVDLKSRELFNASLTPEGIAKESKLKSAPSKVVKNVTKTTKQKITKEEAVNKFGSDAVSKAEEDAKNNTYVDTDGDGKVDTSINDAEDKSDREEQKLNDKKNGWEAGWAAGRKAGLANQPSNPSCTGSVAYQEGYKEGYAQGYANGQKQYQASLAEDEIIDEQITYNVTGVLRDGTEYTSEIEKTEEPKELVRGIQK